MPRLIAKVDGYQYYTSPVDMVNTVAGKSYIIEAKLVDTLIEKELFEYPKEDAMHPGPDENAMHPGATETKDLDTDNDDGDGDGASNVDPESNTDPVKTQKKTTKPVKKKP